MAAAFIRKLLKTPYWTFYAALSTLFLVLGAWAGVSAARWIPFEAIPWPQKSEAAGQADELPANGQRNLLVIGVDRLEGEDPVLESLWLVLYFPGRSPVTLMPLYPRAGQAEHSAEASLPEAFSLAGSGEPGSQFFERLRREQVWWNGYVLLDETALAALLDQLGGADLDGQHLDGMGALNSVPRPWVDRAGALQGQIRLLRSACSQAGKSISGWPDAAALAGKLSQHMRTDVDVSALVQDWLHEAGPEPTLECEFPLLDAP